MHDVTLKFIFDRKNKTAKDSDSKAPVEILIYDRATKKKAYISTGVKLKKDQFSPNGGMSVKNHPNASILKAEAHDVYNRVEAFVLSDRCISIEDAKNWKVKPTDYFVVDFIKDELRKKNPSKAVLDHHKTLIKRIEEFGKIKNFSDINYKTISDFDLFLRKTISAGSTLQKRHSTLRSYIKKAVYMGLCEKDPYFEFKMPSKKGKDPVFLTEEEIKQIQEYQPNFGYLERTRDLFLFQCFTGMAYIDLMNFSKESVFSTEEGYKTLRSNRHKTDERFVCYFLPQAEAIAEKYDYDLPKVTNQKYNQYLKEVAKGAKLTKPLTSHAARHTFATYLLNKNISIESVAGALGHANIKQTQHYAKLLGKTIVNEMAAKLSQSKP